MKAYKKMAAVILAAALAFAVTACGASGSKQEMERGAMSSSAPAAPAAAADDESAMMNADSGGGELTGSTEVSTAVADTSRKLIRRVYLSAESLEFDTLLGNISKRVSELGGYFESSEIGVRGGKGGYDHEYAREMGAPRYANMVIRIPKTRVDEFVSMVSEQSNITTKQENSEDVTLQYVDVESRKKALTAEQESLLTLLAKAEKIEDVIKLQERLSEVRYQLESYESKLRTYDNLVDYSTVTLDVREVQRVTPTEPKTVGSRMSTGFSQTMYNIGQGLQNFAVWFVVNLPYLLVWAVIVIAVIFIIRRAVRKGAAKTAAAIAQRAQMMQTAQTAQTAQAVQAAQAMQAAQQAPPAQPQANTKPEDKK